MKAADMIGRMRLPVLRAGRSETVENLVMGGAIAGMALGIVALELWGRKGDSGPGRYPLDGAVHVMDRTGTAPTVLFESGLGMPVTEWGWVMRALPEGVAAIAYDRPGIGWSRPQGGLARAAYPESLLTVCRSLALGAPFVLVGHSAGGLLIRAFARRYPQLVGGLVFVDSAHPEQYARSGQQQEALERLRNDLDLMIQRAQLGVSPDPKWLESVAQLPQEYHAPTLQVSTRAKALRAARRELQWSVGRWSTEAARLTTVGSRPVAVVSAQRSVDRDPVVAHLHAELAGLSTLSRSVVVPRSTHESLLRSREHAEEVAASISWVVDQLAVARHGDRSNQEAHRV